MNTLDDLKKLRLQHENQFINQEFVESLSKSLLDDLREWANESIFRPLNGDLTLSIPLGAPNARVILRPDRPHHPHIEIRLRLLEEIYRDAFTFPLICGRIAVETNTVETLNQMEMFRGQYFLIDGAVPEVPRELVTQKMSSICEAMIEILAANGDSRICPNDVRCRFLMFELMIVWTFFHEIGHVVQQHYLLRSPTKAMGQQLDTNSEMEDHSVIEEFSEKSLPSSEGVPVGSAQEDASSLRAQAREIMADIDALDLTLTYLMRSGRLCPPVVYLLLCSVGCMFQRFYVGYNDNLHLAAGSHPHPAIRDNIAQQFLVKWLVEFLVDKRLANSKQDAAAPLVYLNVRASLMTGLFRSHRIEKRDSDDTLPSYMRLLSEPHQEEMTSYMLTLLPHIEGQTVQVLQGKHLLVKNRLGVWLQSFRSSMYGR